MDFVIWIADRLEEPSSYAGLAGLLGALHLSTDPGLVHSIAAIGMGVGGVLAFAISETKH